MIEDINNTDKSYFRYLQYLELIEANSMLDNFPVEENLED